MKRTFDIIGYTAAFLFACLFYVCIGGFLFGAAPHFWTNVLIVDVLGLALGVIISPTMSKGLFDTPSTS